MRHEGNPHTIFGRDADRPHRHAEGNRIRLQHRLFRRAGSDDVGCKRDVVDRLTVDIQPEALTLDSVTVREVDFEVEAYPLFRHRPPAYQPHQATRLSFPRHHRCRPAPRAKDHQNPPRSARGAVEPARQHVDRGSTTPSSVQNIFPSEYDSTGADKRHSVPAQ